MESKHILLDLNTVQLPPVVNVHQGDTVRKIYCAICMNGERLVVDPSTTAATFMAMLPGATGKLIASNTIQCTIEDNCVVCDLGKLNLNRAGSGFLTVKLTNKGSTSMHYRPTNIKIIIQKSANS
jgi:hypothetical protein